MFNKKNVGTKQVYQSEAVKLSGKGFCIKYLNNIYLFHNDQIRPDFQEPCRRRQISLNIIAGIPHQYSLSDNIYVYKVTLKHMFNVSPKQVSLKIELQMNKINILNEKS